jgi:hypothetical protein
MIRTVSSPLLTERETSYEGSTTVADQPDEFSDEISVRSGSRHSFGADDVQEDEEGTPRTASSLNNYSILPPIPSTTKEKKSQQQYFIKQLQNKYQADKDGR